MCLTLIIDCFIRKKAQAFIVVLVVSISDVTIQNNNPFHPQDGSSF